MPKGSKNTEWWKNHEQLGHLFEKALRPLQDVHHNYKQRDIVGILRQLDVGIIDKGQTHVTAFVEVQKRTEKVGLKDFGQWIYKMQTLPARELVALSEAGFTSSVVKHVRQLHPDTVRLARIYEIDGSVLKIAQSTMLGLSTLEGKWGFVGVFAQSEENEIVMIEAEGDCEQKIFCEPATNAPLSLMDLVRHVDRQMVQTQGSVFWQSCAYHRFLLNLEEPLAWQGKILKTLMMCIEYRREVRNAVNSFFAYDEEYPVKNRRGACCVSKCFIGQKRATITLVFVPSGITDNAVDVSGQVEFHE